MANKEFERSGSNPAPFSCFGKRSCPFPTSPDSRVKESHIEMKEKYAIMDIN